MDAADFQSAWAASGDEVYRFSMDSLSGSNLPASAKQFLEAVGLPKEAAPFLTFGPATLDWLNRSGNLGLGSFYAVGSDGAGNPIVVDPEGTVWLIDHEAPDRMTLVNSSVQALAECLLAYRSLVMATVAAGGEDAFIDGRIPRHFTEAFSGSLRAMDSAAVPSGTFWGGELSRLFAGADS